MSENTNGQPETAQAVPSPIGSVLYGSVLTLKLLSGYDRESRGGPPRLVSARRPSLLTLVTSGAFPSELGTAVWKMAKQGWPVVNSADPAPADFQRFAEVIEALLPHVLVDPKIGEVTALSENSAGRLTGFIELANLSDADKQHLFYFAQGVIRAEEEIVDAKRQEVTARTLEPFRDGQVGADGGPGGAAVQPAAVDAGGVAT